MLAVWCATRARHFIIIIKKIKTIPVKCTQMWTAVRCYLDRCAHLVYVTPTSVVGDGVLPARLSPYASFISWTHALIPAAVHIWIPLPGHSDVWMDTLPRGSLYPKPVRVACVDLSTCICFLVPTHLDFCVYVFLLFHCAHPRRACLTHLDQATLSTHIWISSVLHVWTPLSLKPRSV